MSLSQSNHRNVAVAVLPGTEKGIHEKIVRREYFPPLDLPLLTNSFIRKVFLKSKLHSPSAVKQKDLQYKKVKKIVSAAVNKNHIFIFEQSLRNHVLQRELLNRGWVQKFTSLQIIEMGNDVGKGLDEEYLKDIGTAQLMLQKIPPNFVWTSKRMNLSNTFPPPFVSRLPKRDLNYDFASKAGLARLNERSHWLSAVAGEDERTAPSYMIPRTYNATDDDELWAFICDFRFTICSSFLYFLYTKLDSLSLYISVSGTKSLDCLVFAIRKSRAMIALKQHSDLDNSADSESSMYKSNEFAKHFNTFRMIMTGSAKIKISSDLVLPKHETAIRNEVLELLKYFPEIPFNGFANMWILKPLASSCGSGILVANTEQKIRQLLDANPKYLLQKYVENPLLVDNTKFDIRQYILFTMRDGFMNVWLYGNCYLKFSSQEFTLKNFSSAIHVTNHTVQKSLKIDRRSAQLPENNMWALQDLEEHLTAIGHPNVWKDTIFPGICNGIKRIVNAALEGITYVENNFQLFGADFLITDDFIPVLLEVNASPDLTHSTPVTASICTSMVEDMVKVVIDRTNDENCSTGNFLKIMEIQMSSPNDQTENLVVYGKCMPRELDFLFW